MELQVTGQSSIDLGIKTEVVKSIVVYDEVDSQLSKTSTKPLQNKVIARELETKQGLLVSGTNIKTINDQSILGSGNITIKGEKGEKGDQGPQGLQGNSAFDGTGVEIVNNLTDGGATAVLSAEQGKILGEVVLGFKPSPKTKDFTPNYSASNGYFERLYILNNYTGHIKLELEVTSAITCNKSDNAANSVAISFGQSEAGLVQNTSFGPEINAAYGAVIPVGTTISYEDDVTNKDIIIRNRCAGGTIQVKYTLGTATEGVVQQVDRNTSEIARLSDVDSKVSEIEGKLTDTHMLNEYSVNGKGANSNTQIKIASGITNVASCKIIAATDIVFTGADGESFISVHAPVGDSNAIQNEIFMRKGTLGETITANTVICDLRELTFAEARSFVIGRRYSGTLKIILDQGISYGLETQVAINTDKIAALEGLGGDVVTLHKEKLLKARQIGYRSNFSDTVNLYPIKPLAFLHMSDSHSTKPNERAIQILNHLGEKGHVKFLMHTGDILVDPRSTSSKSWSDIVSNAQFPVFVSAGNHDVGNWATLVSQQRNDSQFYDYFVAPQIDSWGLRTVAGGTPHPNGKNYYFTDFIGEKIRFIVTYEYEIPIVDALQDGEYAAARGARWISKEQTDWLINALQTTPSGYGVVLVHHAPEGLIGNDVNPFNSPFRNNDNTQQSYQRNMSGHYYRTFFADIVQAFIERKSISYQLQQVANEAYNETLNVVADFRTVPSDIEFICHISGHVHADNISRIDGYPRQLELNINCSSTSESNQRSELLLIEGTSFEDCLNLYGIDRNRGQIYVLRIGADYSSIGERKDMYTFSYR